MFQIDLMKYISNILSRTALVPKRRFLNPVIASVHHAFLETRRECLSCLAPSSRAKPSLELGGGGSVMPECLSSR
jgi:hypothetical protein